MFLQHQSSSSSPLYTKSSAGLIAGNQSLGGKIMGARWADGGQLVPMG